MKFTKPLIKGKLIKRYKRFFTDVKISNEIVTAHCPNTGSMKGLLDEGNEVYISKNDFIYLLIADAYRYLFSLLRRMQYKIILCFRPFEQQLFFSFWSFFFNYSPKNEFLPS